MQRSVQGCCCSRKVWVLLPMFSMGDKASLLWRRRRFCSHSASARNIAVSCSSKGDSAANIMLAQRFEFCLARRINSAIEARAIPIEQSVGSGGVMRNATDMLEDLRSEIDQIDDALHDLLMQRAEVSGEIAKVKQARDPQRQGLVPAFRAAREAAILRRLL